ncbi:PAS domain S-box protein [Phenylobacterium sp. LjRoot225]|uniref:sensor histidine kinase n=1 Tax=Phenylobacterium sp. LjRoot225 TaxID=3342285 RepID=UPI003ECFECCB
MPDARQEQEGRAERNALSETCLAILEQMPIGVVVADVASGRVIWHNKLAQRITGWAWTPVAGASDHAAHETRQDEHDIRKYPLGRAVLDGEVVERQRSPYRRWDDRLIMLETSGSRVSTPDGRQLAVFAFQDVTAEHETQRALQEAAERIQLALDAGAIVGTWVYDALENRLTADELWARSFGLDPDRCGRGLTGEEALASVHPTDRAGLEAAFAVALARGGAYRHQYRVLHRDGVYRWVEATGRVELDETGKPVRFPGVLVDITAWKQAEEARDMLMREVDHRARNALAMVQSVVRLTEASDPARYREEVIGRVDAMARAQSSLSRSNWAGGGLEDLTRAELSSYASPQQFTLEGPKITLPAEQVQPLNMIIHELTTNAVKYGSLSDAAGKVEVSCKVGPGGEGQLTWREGSGPPVKTPERKGFGSRLMERLATQLGGSIEMDWQVTGLVATLTWRI